MDRRQLAINTIRSNHFDYSPMLLTLFGSYSRLCSCLAC